MYELIVTENDVHLEDGTRIHRYVPPIPPKKKGKHTITPAVTWYDGNAVHTKFDLTAMNDKEASLLVWIMAIRLAHSPGTALWASDLKDSVRIYFKPRMHGLKNTNRGVHGPFGRGLMSLKGMEYPWLKQGTRWGRGTFWIELPDHEQLSLLRREV